MLTFRRSLPGWFTSGKHVLLLSVSTNKTTVVVHFLMTRSVCCLRRWAAHLGTGLSCPPHTPSPSSFGDIH